MTPGQRALLKDKVEVWRSQSTYGNLDLRDYNRRAADALETALADAATTSILLEALEEIFSSFKDLADSGDAGFWKVEETPEGQKALAAIAKARRLPS